MNRTTRTRATLALCGVSGFTALVYQVLWLRLTALLFGNTALAASATLAAFFLGLAAGGYTWGRRSARARPLRTYAWLELGIAVTAVGVLFLAEAHALVAGLGEVAFSPWVKLLLALVVLFPPAFFMGGTFPVLCHVLTGDDEGLGRAGSRIYAINTGGAALGALAAGFVLTPSLGVRATLGIAIGLNTLVAVAAGAISARPRPDGDEALPASEPTSGALGAAAWVAAFSGFAALALEVLLTRTFALFTLNGVYAFTAVLVTFLVCLAAGGWLARWLSTRSHPRRALVVLLALGGVFIAVLPGALYAATDGLRPLYAQSEWGPYFGKLVGVLLVTMLPITLIGAVFPLSLRMVEDHPAGPAAGRLVAVNTLGGIAGSVVAGFALLPWLGLLGAFGFVAAAYALAAAILAGSCGFRRGAIAAGVAAAAVAGAYPVVGPLLGVGPDEQLVRRWNGAHGTVALVKVRVADDAHDLLIRLDHHYTLGGLGAQADERRQADLPLLLHKRPRRVCFLGLATGITSGAALDHPEVEQVVIAELIPEVIEAARAFGEQHALFSDARVRIVPEDGRNLLLASPARYDVIVADLFRPWTAAALYTREHFETVRARLEPGGAFAQWLPLYQLSGRELAGVIRTFCGVFPQATLWRGNFAADTPIVCLVGRAEPTPLDPARLASGARALPTPRALSLLLDTQGRRRATTRPPAAERLLPQLSERLLLTLYLGNLTANVSGFAHAPIHTDDWPWLEWSGPRTPPGDRMRGGHLAKMADALRTSLPIARDPYLARLTPAQRRWVEAGALYARVALDPSSERSRGSFKRYRALLDLRKP